MPNMRANSTLKVASAALVFRSRAFSRGSFAAIFWGLCSSTLTSCYTLKQAYYQGNLLSTRRPIEVLLWDKSTPPKLRQSLQQTEDIRSYARQAGLAVGGAYGTYIESPHSAVSYIVQAAKPLELKLKTWSFPVIGAVPYLGFYNESGRDAKAAELRRAGYDVSESSAGAFSSLGWYDDPVYSPMLHRSIHSLAHLFFHELTHRTFWIPDAAELNEHLAEFVAIVLTKQYLTARNQSKMLEEYEAGLTDRRLYAEWLARLRDDLKRLYASSDAPSRKLERKQALFDQYLNKGFPAFASRRYRSLKGQRWNNAVVLGASLYQPEIEPFERAYTCGRFESVGTFLNMLEERMDTFNTDDDPSEQVVRKALESLCPESRVGG